MLKFLLKPDGGKTLYEFPTTMNELTLDYLKDVTSHIAVAEHHSLIGIIYKETISSVILTAQQKKKSFNASIIPIFIKAGETDSDFIKTIKPKDKILIASSDLALSYHVSVPQNTLSIERFLKEVSKDNTNTYTRALETNATPVFFLDFKIVPNTAIKAAYNSEQETIDNPYTSFISDNQAEA